MTAGDTGIGKAARKERTEAGAQRKVFAAGPVDDRPGMDKPACLKYAATTRYGRHLPPP
jgi:hypothetical protein